MTDRAVTDHPVRASTLGTCAVPSSRSPFASASVPRHLARGAGALLAGAVALRLLEAGGLPGGLGAVLAGGVAVVLMRGCPTCWLVRLFETARPCTRCETAPPPQANDDRPPSDVRDPSRSAPAA